MFITPYVQWLTAIAIDLTCFYYVMICVYAVMYCFASEARRCTVPVHADFYTLLTNRKSLRSIGSRLQNWTRSTEVPAHRVRNT